MKTRASDALRAVAGTQEADPHSFSLAWGLLHRSLASGWPAVMGKGESLRELVIRLLLLSGLWFAVPAEARDGKTVYGQTCAACHGTGLAGAPLLGDKTAWAPRVASGRDKLLTSVMKGKGNMPVKAGNPSLSEKDIRAAIEYMLEQIEHTK
jgi:cytochrome c5